MYVDVDVPTLCPPEIMKMNREIISIKLFGHWGPVGLNPDSAISRDYPRAV